MTTVCDGASEKKWQFVNSTLGKVYSGTDVCMKLSLFLDVSRDTLH